jgi:hypothetical protein
VWDKEIVHKIASEQQMPEEYVKTKDERVDSFIERTVGFSGMGGFESAYNIPPPLWLHDTQLVRWTQPNNLKGGNPHGNDYREDG